MKLSLYVIATFATYRLWRLVALDKITARPREAWLNRHPHDAARSAVVGTWQRPVREVVFSARPASLPRPFVSTISQWLMCPWCSGSACSALVVALLTIWVPIALPVLFWAAVAGGVGLVSLLDR